LVQVSRSGVLVLVLDLKVDVLLTSLVLYVYVSPEIGYLCKKKLTEVGLKTFPNLMSASGGADLRFHSRQPDTSRSYRIMDTG